MREENVGRERKLGKFCNKKTISMKKVMCKKNNVHGKGQPEHNS